MLRRRREKKRLAEAARQRVALEEEAADLLRKAESNAELADLLSDPASIWDESDPDLSIIPKRGEEVLYLLRGVALAELRTVTRSYKGSSHGMSIRIAKGVYYRPGMHAGKITESSEEWKILDTSGDMVVSNQRVVYSGSRYSREFPFAKLVSWGVALESKQFTMPVYLITLPVSSRVRTSAVAFPVSGSDEHRETTLSMIQCAIALYSGTYDDFMRQLRDDIKDLRSQSNELRNQALALSVEL